MTKIEIGGRTGARQDAHVRRRRRSSTHIIRARVSCCYRVRVPGSLFAKELLTDLITFDSLLRLAARILIDREPLFSWLPFPAAFFLSSLFLPSFLLLRRLLSARIFKTPAMLDVGTRITNNDTIPRVCRRRRAGLVNPATSAMG